MVRTWSGRYNPGLEWTMPGAWPQNIVNTLIQAQHDVEKGHTRWKHSKLREALEKDFPSDGSKRSPEANERLKRLHYQEQAEYKSFSKIEQMKA